ncbi:hypothetical protein Tco_0025483 [Tanacetum coccineum]
MSLSTVFISSDTMNKSIGLSTSYVILSDSKAEVDVVPAIVPEVPYVNFSEYEGTEGSGMIIKPRPEVVLKGISMFPLLFGKLIQLVKGILFS